MKKLLHLYNYGHNPFPKLGKGGLGYHLPQYKIKGGTIIVDENDEIIEDDGDDDNPVLLNKDKNVIGAYDRDSMDVVRGLNTDAGFHYNSLLGFSRTNTDKIDYPEYNVFKKYGRNRDEILNRVDFEEADKAFDKLQVEFDKEQEENKKVDKVEKVDDYDEEEKKIETNESPEDRKVSEILSNLMSNENYDKKLWVFINKFSDTNFYKKDGTIDQRKLKAQDPMFDELIDYIFTTSKTKEQIDYLFNRICKDIYDIDPSALEEEEDDDSEPLDKSLFEVPEKTEFLSSKEIGKIKKYVLYDDEESDDDDDVLIDLTESLKHDPYSILQRNEVYTDTEKNIGNLLYSDLVVKSEGAGKDLELFLFENSVLLNKILSTAENNKKISDVDIKQSTKRFAIVDAEGTIKVDNTPKEIEVECKKFRLPKYKKHNSIIYMEDYFKNDFNDWYYKNIITKIKELNIGCDDKSYKERKELLRIISKNGKIDPERLDLLYLEQKGYIYAPITQTKFERLPQDFKHTPINPKEGIDIIKSKQTRKGTKNKKSLHDEIAVIGVKDGCLTGNITKKINRMLDVYCEVHNVSRSSVHPLTILKLVMTPYQGKKYDNIGYPYHWLSSVNTSGISPYVLSKNDIAIMTAKAKQNEQLRSAKKAMKQNKK